MLYTIWKLNGFIKKKLILTSPSKRKSSVGFLVKSLIWLFITL